MLGITKQEAELLGTFSLSLKMKNHRKTVAYFKDQFQQDPGNKEKAFNYGMCMSVYIVVDKNDSEKLRYLVEINEAFQHCLKQQPEWWLVRYLRSELNEEIPEEDFSGTGILSSPAFKDAKPADDRRILIQQQEAASVKHGYFLVPYICQARDHIRRGDFDAAVRSYHTGLAAVPVKRSPYHFFYLTRPLYHTIVYLRKMEKSELADQLKEHALTVFPEAKNLCMT